MANWTPEEDQLLQELAKQMSFRKLAIHFPTHNCSHSACIKRHGFLTKIKLNQYRWLNLKHKKQPVPKSGKLKPVSMVALINRATPNPNKPNANSKMAMPEESQVLKTLFELNDNDCRYTFENPDRSAGLSFLFCAKPKIGQSYCKDHTHCDVRR